MSGLFDILQRRFVVGFVVGSLNARLLVSSLVTICYLAVLMSNRTFTKQRKAAAPDLDPATLAQQKTFERLRRRADRALLKRRRKKSGQ